VDDVRRIHHEILASIPPPNQARGVSLTNESSKTLTPPGLSASATMPIDIPSTQDPRNPRNPHNMASTGSSSTAVDSAEDNSPPDLVIESPTKRERIPWEEKGKWATFRDASPSTEDETTSNTAPDLMDDIEMSTANDLENEDPAYQNQDKDMIVDRNCDGGIDDLSSVSPLDLGGNMHNWLDGTSTAGAGQSQDAPRDSTEGAGMDVDGPAGDNAMSVDPGTLHILSYFLATAKDTPHISQPSKNCVGHSRRLFSGEPLISAICTRVCSFGSDAIAFGLLRI
jgi:hypothetical protein